MCRLVSGFTFSICQMQPHFVPRLKNSFKSREHIQKRTWAILRSFGYSSLISDSDIIWYGTTIHRYQIFSTRYSVTCKVYTGYHGTSEIEHGLCAFTVGNSLAKVRGYLSVQAHKPCSVSHMESCNKSYYN